MLIDLIIGISWDFMGFLPPPGWLRPSLHTKYRWPFRRVSMKFHGEIGISQEIGQTMDGHSWKVR